MLTILVAADRELSRGFLGEEAEFARMSANATLMLV